MSDIIGTIISVGDFLNNEDKEIRIKKAGEDGYNVFNLKKIENTLYQTSNVKLDGVNKMLILFYKI